MTAHGKTALHAGVAATCLLAGAAAAQDAVTLNVWTDTPRLASFEAYDAMREDIALNILTVAPADLIAKLQLAMQAGADVPDIIFMSDIGYGSQLTTRTSNYLMDLTDQVSAELVDEFYPNANSPCLINGQLMCLRNDIAHFVIWYNAAQMAELGMAVPTTWEEFEQLGADLAPMGMVLGSGVEPYPLLNFLVSGGCPIAMPVEGADDTVTIDLTSDVCVRAAQMVDRMIANGSLAKVGPFDPAFTTLATEGKVPLFIGPTWFGEYVIKPSFAFSEGALAAATPPRWSDQDAPLTWSWGGGTFGGWKDSAHPAETLELLIWAAADVTNQTTAVTLPAHEPSAIAWGQALRADAFYADDTVFDVLVDSAAYSHPGYVSLRFSVSDAIAKTLVASVAGGGTIEEALPALQEELVNLAQLNGYQVQ